MNFDSLLNVMKRLAEELDFKVVITVENGKIAVIDFEPLEMR